MAKGVIVFLAIFTSIISDLRESHAQPDIGTEIVSLTAEKCLDVGNGSLTSGADVRQYSCYEGANQKWMARDASAPGYVYFVNQNSGLCLDVRIGGAQGGTLQQYTCHYRDNQLFRLEPQADPAGGVRIVAKHSGYCLDVPSGSTQDAVLIQQYPCHLGRNQRWVYAPSGPYSFQVSATPIGRHPISLRDGQSYSFSLSNLVGVVPFMHLWSNVHGNVTPLGQNMLASRVPTLSYVVPAGKGGAYTLFVHAAPGAAPGTATLTVRENGSVVRQNVNFSFGGTVVDVPRSTNLSPFRYETVALPGGVDDTFILALDNLNYLKGFDDDSGIGRASRITGAGTSRIVVGTVNGISGPSVLYVNDVFRDNDGDGLGYGLERELGICDMKNVQARCATVFNLSDTDRDGIEDRVEVLGVDVPPNVQNGQTAPAASFLFPKWGANPRHKDIFFELDYIDEIGVNPFTHAYALAVQGLFSGALASEIGNKDNQDGINVHLDIGRAPQAGYETLYGNWGNGGTHGAAAARSTWQLQYPGHDNRKEPWFFPVVEYGTAGTGSFGFNDQTWHEFNHTLLIGHESVRGGLNSSVVTPALVSYTQWRNPDAKFLGNQFLESGINSSSLCESSNEIGTALSDPSYQTYLLNKHGIWSDANTVDWNRDGVITNCATGGRVKANLSAGPTDNDAPVQGEQTISKTDGTAGGSFGVGSGDVVGTIVGAPQMVRLGSAPNSFLYIFYAKTDPSYGTRLYYRAGRVGSDKSIGGCASSAGMEFLGNGWGPGTTTPCITWSNAALVSLIHGLKRFAVTALSDRIEIAASNSSDSNIHFYHLSSQNNSTGLMGTGPSLVGGLKLSSSPRSDLQYEIVRAPLLTGDKVNEHLALFWIDTNTRELRWASKPAGTTQVPILRGALWNDASPSVGLVAHDNSSLSLASWGTGMTGSLARETFLFFHNSRGTGSIYKLDPASEKWVDITSTALPNGNCSTLGQKIGFRFQEAVNSSGDILQAGKGHFYLTYLNCGGPAVVTLNSGTVNGKPTALSATRKPSAYLTFDRGIRAFPNQGHPIYGVTGIAYYSDSFVTSLKEAYVDADGALQFLPFADGILKMQYKPTNQFKILEATICRALKSHPQTGLSSWSPDWAAGDAFCGNNGMRFSMDPKNFVPSTQTLWGY
ncbi:ricin-type beta-trefoil lectin domain protein [Nordella sp. HKS 07]|uniref:RICIN domain-containing protein n=1 Tax=Nordella sp. HKS 07 TaxID=2712222 RepID=UPI0013E10A64|nr:RICIN domain-containing protein [Nordella sp. HKS 07]QIG49436.1 ricin-type beta-trefoil lectin domain protein [Nordella sp. HKS 07]